MNLDVPQAGQTVWKALASSAAGSVISGMPHIEGCDRDQSQFLPARVDDHVHAENPVRFIDAFAGGLDLGRAGFARVDPKMTGRPGYDPADLLKLYIYGYVNRVQSSDGSKPRPTATSRSSGC